MMQTAASAAAFIPKRIVRTAVAIDRFFLDAKILGVPESEAQAILANAFSTATTSSDETSIRNARRALVLKAIEGP